MSEGSKRRLDSRVKTLIENCVQTNQRSMFVVIGDNADYVKARGTSRLEDKVLWCYTKEFGFGSSGHKKKQLKKLQKQGHTRRHDGDDEFMDFVKSTEIRKCFYKETQNILGNTFDMCVLQDFEGLRADYLARTIETVKGGGMIIFLLKTMTSYNQLYTMSMDVHTRYRTAAHQTVVKRFNERFLLSLTRCENVLLMTDSYEVLPFSSLTLQLKPVKPKSVDDPPSEQEVLLREYKSKRLSDQPTGALVDICCTYDQAEAVSTFMVALTDKSLRSTVALTAARGRGKSAAIGLAIAGAVSLGYSNIFVTAPSPENLHAVFEFILKGLSALHYRDISDYEIIRSTNPDFKKCVVRITISRDHRQTIQYIDPTDASKLGLAELVCIDEAAAIPLPIVKSLLGPYTVFISSTVHGYEGTGRSLSLKLLNELAKSASSSAVAPAADSRKDKAKQLVPASTSNIGGRVVRQLELKESIRYAENDAVERWLYDLLCLNVTELPPVLQGLPDVNLCDLFYVNRDTLFSYNPMAELFLKHLVNIYVSSHYKNSPNDLQMLSDAPAHHLFCLINRESPKSNALPQIICVIQVCLEGQITREEMLHQLSQGQSGSGDMIPWLVQKQFLEVDFGKKSGARIIRIATHPNYQHLGYGSRAMKLLIQYYRRERVSLVECEKRPQNLATVDQTTVISLTEQPKPRQNLPPLLLELEERLPERLDYIGVCYGVTQNLLKFWKKFGLVPVFVNQKPNELTGEHTCLMLKSLTDDEEPEKSYLAAYWRDFRHRFVHTLSLDNMRKWPTSLALEMLMQTQFDPKDTALSIVEFETLGITAHDVNRLKQYATNKTDNHLISDLVPILARLFFLGRLRVDLPVIFQSMLLGVGLQFKSFEALQKEWESVRGDRALTLQQVMGNFHRIMLVMHSHITKLQESAIEKELPLLRAKDSSLKPLPQSVDDELAAAARDEDKKRKREQKKLSKYELPPEEALTEALKSGSFTSSSSISVPVPRTQKQDTDVEPQKRKKKKKKDKGFKPNKKQKKSDFD